MDTEPYSQLVDRMKKNSEEEYLGPLVRECRIKINVSQSTLARMVGVHTSTIIGWERGEHQPKLEHLAPLAAALGVSEHRLRSCIRNKRLHRVKQDLVGRRFGRLVIIAIVGADIRGRGHKSRVHAVCDCGGTVTTDRSGLLRGMVNSCGCLRRETIREMVKNSPRKQGENVFSHKLTEESVVAILALRSETAKTLGERFGVHPSTIERIRASKTWTHIPRVPVEKLPHGQRRLQ